METESQDDRRRSAPGASLVTSWVMALLVIVMSTFFAQFPETRDADRSISAAR